MGLRECITLETVADLPLRQALTVSPQTTVRQCIRIMRDHKLGCVFVVNSENRPLGKFTERQVLKIVRGCESLDEPVIGHSVPIPDCGQVRMTDPVSKVLECMRRAHLRFICVLDDNGKVVALTGQKGLVEYITEHFPRQIKVQKMASKLHMNSREGA